MRLPTLGSRRWLGKHPCRARSHGFGASLLAALEDTIPPPWGARALDHVLRFGRLLWEAFWDPCHRDQPGDECLRIWRPQAIPEQVGLGDLDLTLLPIEGVQQACSCTTCHHGGRAVRGEGGSNRARVAAEFLQGATQETDLGVLGTVLGGVVVCT